ncbi:hypothetical protein [Helicobacter sp. 11S02596-1]|uniref:hypothetical protein n=1 Tax=Helicobacter sp. 11S02596-1 TaxID=1476194 RepID=UPI000BA62413|nr:hypothetical protein [Helicobacter sp. 11S02596-1]PAF42803.1 hypothetical protein BJI48_05980 [Helicobacter sp. 11S02596-1]
MKKILLTFLLSTSFLIATHQNPNQNPAQTPSKIVHFPAHLDQCIDGYLYRVFLDEHNQIIPSSIHQVMEKSTLHEKMLPKQCK